MQYRLSQGRTRCARGTNPAVGMLEILGKQLGVVPKPRAGGDVLDVDHSEMTSVSAYSEQFRDRVELNAQLSRSVRQENIALLSSSTLSMRETDLRSPRLAPESCVSRLHCWHPMPALACCLSRWNTSKSSVTMVDFSISRHHFGHICAIILTICKPKPTAASR